MISSPSRRAFSSGNSFSDSAQAFSTVGTSSLRSRPEKSHSSTHVTAGTSRCARAMCSAISRRTPRSGSRRPSCGPAALRTSSSVIRPWGPLPLSDSRSTPSSRATLRTSGVARPLPAGFGDCAWVGAASARGGPPSGSPPITTSTVPTGTTFPSSTRIRVTFPAAGDGISTVVLSVWISTSGSSSATSWPSDTSQRAISPSVSPSPRSGSLNSYAISALTHSLSKSRVADDEAVSVELYVRREGSRAKPDDAGLERDVALNGTLNRQLGHGHECHRVFARVAAYVEAVAQDRQRVEERRRLEIEIEDVVLERRRATAEVERAGTVDGVDLGAQVLADERLRRLEHVREAVVRAKLRSACSEPIVAKVDERDLEQPWSLPRIELHRGVPIHASLGTIRTRSPPSTRHKDSACSSPRSSGAISRGT